MLDNLPERSKKTGKGSKKQTTLKITGIIFAQQKGDQRRTKRRIINKKPLQNENAKYL